MNDGYGVMLHGVDAVLVQNADESVSRKPCDGRAFLWTSGAVTVYSEHQSIPWQLIPAHRVVSIVGKEHG